MRYLLLVLFLLLAPSSVSAVWFDSNWDYRVKVEVAPSKVGTTSAITNFPVYVDLSQFPASFFTNASSTGADIRVTESDGSTETPFELVNIGTQIATTATTYIYASTTWTLPSTSTSQQITVEAWGGGGGGGDGLSTGGSGGGGGAYARTVMTVATGTAYTVTIGSGGLKGGVTSAGTHGGTTTFSGTSVVQAAPGNGGLGCSSASCTGQPGGTTANSIGSTTYAGGTGGNSNNTGDVGGGGGGAAGVAGAGGNASGATFGVGTPEGGNGGQGGVNAGAGANGTVPGGGGGGGEENATAGTGHGANGMVKITYQIATTTVTYGELHFLADALSTTSTSTFYVYYGNPNAAAYAVTDTYGRNAVWSDYIAVYHLQSSSTDSKGSFEGTDTSITYTEAKLRNGASFNGTTDRISTGASTSFQFGEANSFTIQLWYKPTSRAVNHFLFGRQDGAGSAGFRGYSLYVKDTSGGIRWDHYSDLAAGGNNTRDWAAVMGENSVNYMLHLVSAGTSAAAGINLYKDGSVFSATTVADTLSGSTDITRNYNIGNRDGSNLGTDGVIDEHRVRASALSSSWILTEYNNQSSPSTFFYIGAEETEGAPPAATSTDSGIIWFD